MTRRAAVIAKKAPEPERLAYRVDELVSLLGVGRSTIYRAIKDGRLRSANRLGARLIDAESVRAVFGRAAE
ncbi:helix-turn-helix domain-containing protein [Rhodoblastus sp.]|uniref:helix-turn-helix domain-containing protein n=1 Tax=Rhodoblastus sp. TaxID=1962975 RepID=UPI003F94C4D8